MRGMSRRNPPRDLRSLLADASASTAVEFALLVPLYLLLILGMTAYGIYFGAAHSVQQLSADAARTAVAGLNASERRDLAQRFIANNADGYLFIDGRKLTVEVGDSATDPSQFAVALRYDASELPIWALWENLPMPDRIILRRATIRMGGM